METNSSGTLDGRLQSAPIYQGEADTGKTVVVCGAGGFIGGHLVADLLRQGYSAVRAVDIKPPNRWFQKFPQADNRSLDLREKENCYRALENADHVYNQELQDTADVEPLAEEDAYPALAEDGYGWEKLFSERMCRHFREDFDVTTRVARYHNVYGPFGTYDGGREKAPAALTRKAIEAKLSGSGDIVIWGDGTQTRSFMYIDDCVDGTQRIMHSGITDPINLGSDELVTINELVGVIEKAAGVDLEREYDRTKPQGVDGRNSDNTRILNKLGWVPPTALRDGMEVTAEWIEQQMRTHREAKTTSRFTVPH
jgi:nucleoside-diphosphate-sugar epimerase